MDRECYGNARLALGVVMPSGLERSIVQRLSELGETLVTAESCTGGLLAHRITNVSGSSVCYLGGVVAYSDRLKEQVLGVARASLENHGAVSEVVAREMAQGARARWAADFAMAVTGIAGPTGGTPEKPVGLVYIAVAREGETRVTKRVFSGSRLEIKEQTADQALAMLWEWIR